MWLISLIIIFNLSAIVDEINETILLQHLCFDVQLNWTALSWHDVKLSFQAERVANIHPKFTSWKHEKAIDLINVFGSLFCSN